MRALSQDLCGCTMIKVLWKVSQQVCIWFPTGQGSCVGSSTATVYRTSHLTLNSSHIRLISTGKCHLLSVWIQYELAWHCATHIVADLYSTRPPLWKSNTNMSSWPSQTLESQLISSIQTPTASILPVSFSLLQFVFQTCLFFVLPTFFGFSIKLFWTTLIVKNKTKKKWRMNQNGSARPNQLFNFPVLLDPADEKLLEEDIQAPSSSKRSVNLSAFVLHTYFPILKHLLVYQVAAACKGGSVDEKDRVHLDRVQPLWSFEWESGGQVSPTKASRPSPCLNFIDYVFVQLRRIFCLGSACPSNSSSQRRRSTKTETARSRPLRRRLRMLRNQ